MKDLTQKINKHLNEDKRSMSDISTSDFKYFSDQEKKLKKHMQNLNQYLNEVFT
ncbi:MAG: hypothetical protein ACOCQD_02485 [archaeon]